MPPGLLCAQSVFHPTAGSSEDQLSGRGPQVGSRGKRRDQARGNPVQPTQRWFGLELPLGPLARKIRAAGRGFPRPTSYDPHSGPRPRQ